MAEIVVATCTYRGTHDLGESLERHHRLIDEAADAGASLVVFPEISLHGYPSIEMTEKRLRATFEASEPVPDGPSVLELAAHAVDRAVHVVYGLNETGREPGVIYNTAVLTGPDGHIGAYRKVHVHPVESITWRHGKDFPVFDTALGRIGIMICYDKWWPESARELTLRGADILICPSAWPSLIEGDDVAEHGSLGSIEGSITNRGYCLYDEVRALENARWVISSNYVGQFAGLEFGGLSRIVDPLGQVLATTGSTEGLAVATIDVREGIQQAAAALMGARIVRDRHPDAYRALRGEIPTAIDG